MVTNLKTRDVVNIEQNKKLKKGYNHALDDVEIILNSHIENLLDSAHKDFTNSEDYRVAITEIKDIKNIIKKLKEKK